MQHQENPNGLAGASPKARRRRRASAIVALLLVIAMLFSGTYAWNYYRDHKTNEANSDVIRYKARLVEEYDAKKTENWKVTDPNVTKTISVTNPGAETEFDESEYGDIYVRIQLKEFMELYPTTLVYSENRYMINDNNQDIATKVGINTEPGSFIAFYDLADAETFVRDLEDYYGNGPRPNTMIKQERMWYTPTKAEDPDNGVDDVDLPYYIQTIETDPNGVYGAFMVLDYKKADKADKSLVNGVYNHSADQSTHHNSLVDTADSLDFSTWAPDNGECGYTVHTWESGLDEFDGNLNNVDWASDEEYFTNYVKWIYGDDVKLLSDWTEAYIDGNIIRNVWVVDDRTDLDGNGDPIAKEGWVYWIGALAPGESTTNFLESIMLTNQPHDAFYYAIHTDMQAVSLNQMFHWYDDMPPEIRDVFEEIQAYAVVISGPSTVTSGSTTPYTAEVFGNYRVPQGVTWEIVDNAGHTAVDIGQENGELYVPTDFPHNATITIRATSTFDDTKYDEKVIFITGNAVIESIEIDTAPITLYRAGYTPNTQTFSATVTFVGATEDDTVTWSVSGNTPGGGTTIDPVTGVLTVGANEASNALIVTATSNYKTDEKTFVTVNVVQASSVTITGTLGTVTVGENAGLAAVVNPITPPGLAVPGGVTWSFAGFTGGASTGFAIDPITGVVTVPAITPVTSLTVRATSVYDNTKFATLSIGVDAATITGISAAFEADRFRIVSGTSSNTFNKIDENILTSSGVYRVASAEYDTVLSVITTTTGTPKTSLNQTPVVKVAYSESNGDPILDSNGDPILDSKGNPITQMLDFTGTEDLANNTDREPVPAGKFQVDIPANFVGTITVTVNAIQDPTQTTTFTLTVDSLLQTIRNRTAESLNNGKFFIDDMAWRVLSKRVGTRYNNGRGVLILSEHALETAQWNNTTGAGTDFRTSTMRNVTLPAIFNKLTWAHGIAVVPNQDASWTSVGNSSQTSNAGNNGARITTSYAPVPGTFYDGLFLLSYGETTAYRLVASNANTASARNHANLLDGTPVCNWMRSSNTYYHADLTTCNGTQLWNNNNGGVISTKTNVHGVRPLMILDFGDGVPT